ncbi:MAG: thiosulfate sulfurtransferase GlpE [Burkholderiales bacterium]|nr:thiosulfate sulfurtransferase GlpE [Burkholderiales bacterium]MDP2396925.1 thiosulfate sulfurtransferase GlpE [Burkholderiales bacterium]
MDAGNTPRITPQKLIELRPQSPAVLVIDVRREAVFQNAADRIAGALRRDPATVTDWAGALPAAKHIVVYCVHGHEVSQNAARALCERGFPAQFLEGGIEAWRAAGGELTPSNSLKK